VVEWTWFEEQQEMAPDTREFRIYYHPRFQTAAVKIVSVGTPTVTTVKATLSAKPGFDPTGGLLVARGTLFRILGIAGTVLTLQRSAKPNTNGSVDYSDPPLGTASVHEAMEDPEKWQDRLHVEPLDASKPAKNYRVEIPGSLLSPSKTYPVATGWIGVTAVDDKDYIVDDPHRTGALAGRPGNESLIAVRARVTAVDHSVPEAGPLPGGAEFATRADFYGRSRYTLSWNSEPSTTYHLWRATESAIHASDFVARRSPPTKTYYFDNNPLDDDPEIEDWLASEFPGLSKADLLANTPTAQAEDAWSAWERRFYDRDALSDDMLRAIAGRTPNETAFTRITKEPVATGSLDDEFDGRVLVRYVYRIQSVNTNGLVGPLGEVSQPIRIHDVVPPSQPVITKMIVASRAATLTWSANRERDLDYYQLYRARTDIDADTADIRTMELRAEKIGPTETSYTDGELVPGFEYDYVLVAADTSGNTSAASRPRRIRAIALEAPEPPALSAVRSGDGLSVELAWEIPEEGCRALLERTDDPAGRWQVLSGWLAVNTTSYEDASPPAGTACYRLKLLDSAGNLSSYSDAVRVG
jgi:hypothetical protein